MLNLASILPRNPPGLRAFAGQAQQLGAKVDAETSTRCKCAWQHNITVLWYVIQTQVPFHTEHTHSRHACSSQEPQNRQIQNARKTDDGTLDKRTPQQKKVTRVQNKRMTSSWGLSPHRDSEKETSRKKPPVNCFQCEHHCAAPQICDSPTQKYSRKLTRVTPGKSRTF